MLNGPVGRIKFVRLAFFNALLIIKTQRNIILKKYAKFDRFMSPPPSLLSLSLFTELLLAVLFALLR